ncbi:uncharacterized protein VDAG_08630 [Verticillium dahliae VdLs.17]|uniref:F-box domain-containing protein n=1 Tax=Verticillium dahliae (strain VdLs.17 / ATCC MYA-4575 / FGSC 10137) TaxID=498257 RepID=G2XEP5_VERDV|nr:uncharacterized protein VDAG_08630 [Verticillium dahliae VdLs.17]EGY18296.1 hypothetical protein VDAG_08630 [Verticillium dahliae VdLs.17]KAH6686122.1 hypothetical protein EV126DRAFT_350384 [Verticillium dahliae]KAH6709692.1 hypothetical protein EV126DRAFT_437737 [Verticillium dahliae]
MARLDRLPFEVLAIIAADLAPRDIHSTSLTCHRLNWALMHNDYIAKKTLQAMELKDASSRNFHGSYAHGLRRFVKRQLAVRTANPFFAGVVAMVDAFVYSNGMLCYTSHDRGTVMNTLRLLDLRQPSSAEIVIHLTHIGFGGSVWNLKPLVEPIYYADGFVSCIFRPTSTSQTKQNTHSTLLVFRPASNQLVLTYPLARPGQEDFCFVRNNSEQVWIGEWENVADGRGCLVLQLFDVPSRTWKLPQVRTPAPVGDELGKTVCVEIIGNYMYVVSNSATSNANQARDADWMSHYYAVRFPLAAPQKLEVAPKEGLWRRNHKEGPIHGTTISLETDTHTGKLVIVEVRKESPEAVWPPVTTSYKTFLDFAPAACSNPPVACKEQASGFREASLVHTLETSQRYSSYRPYIRSYHQDSESFLEVFPYYATVSGGEISSPTQSWLRLRSVTKSSEAMPAAFWPVGATPNLHTKLNPYFALNPRYPGRFQVQGTADDRSIVYALGERGPNVLRPVVLLSFDPGYRHRWR